MTHLRCCALEVHFPGHWRRAFCLQPHLRCFAQARASFQASKQETGLEITLAIRVLRLSKSEENIVSVKKAGGWRTFSESRVISLLYSASLSDCASGSPAEIIIGHTGSASKIRNLLQSRS